MQIVIEIDDNLYSQIKYLEPKANNMLDKLMRSIQNGTPLPKGHGAIVDKKDFYELLNKEQNDDFVLKADNVMCKVKAIIEADRSEEDAEEA